MNYEQFLQSKVKLAKPEGLPVAAGLINGKLKPHQKACVEWLVKGGRRALFASFGLGKSVMQLETVRLTLEAEGGGRGLIVCPLGVKQEFARDAVELLGWAEPPKFIRRIEEAGETGVYLTNYETIRDGKMDPAEFLAVSLDEAAVLRGFGGSKTFREFMLLCTGDGGPSGRSRDKTVKYRFVATATPSPNEYIELLAYAEFLGVMDISQAKTRFFKRDSTKADKLTLHAHKEQEFWLWVASWALFVQKPSDLGFDDTGYAMPEMQVNWHCVSTDYSHAGYEKSGQGKLLRDAAIGVQDAAAEKRVSLPRRIEKMLELVQAGQRQGYDFPAPQNIEEQVTDRALAHVENFWIVQRIQSGAKAKEALGTAGGSSPDLALWMSGPKGITYHQVGSETLIPWKAIEARAKLYTPRQSKHVLIWHDLEDERKAIQEALPDSVAVWGSQDLDERETRIIGFSNGEFPVLSTKPVIAGSGCNFQRHCHWEIFLGIGFKFADFIQAIHRVYRFMQEHPVRIDIIYTEAEYAVKKTLERKWQQHNEMVKKMSEIIQQFGLSQAAMAQTLTRKMGVDEVITAKGERFTLINNDCVKEASKLADNSIDLICTSIPFSTQYEYSPNYADFGHSEGNEEFFGQMGYLTPSLLRALKPGRLALIHVKDRIVPGGMTGLGFQTVYPFHMRTTEHFVKHGFAYMGMKTIVTDVVRENNQTYRLGWTEQCKDGTKMGVGMPEYLLMFRKPPTDKSDGYADAPVRKFKGDEKICKNCRHIHPRPKKKEPPTNCEKCKGELVQVTEDGMYETRIYTRARWQADAHGFARSSGNRPLGPEDFVGLKHDEIFQLFKKHSLEAVYDFENHVRIAEAIDAEGKLPVTFMLLQPQSWSDEVWADVTRMLTLNGTQWSKGKEMHLCPMQFDIADRCIAQFTEPGELVLDPFAGLGTVPYRAILKGRRGLGFELNPAYFLDAVSYCQAAEAEVSMPALFDLDALTQKQAA